jgi:hypothetical protein
VRANRSNAPRRIRSAIDLVLVDPVLIDLVLIDRMVIDPVLGFLDLTVIFLWSFDISFTESSLAPVGV